MSGGETERGRCFCENVHMAKKEKKGDESGLAKVPIGVTCSGQNGLETGCRSLTGLKTRSEKE